MPRPRGPIRVAVLNDYELVVKGVAAALAPFADRVQVVELDAGVPVAGAVDVVLYDTFGQAAFGEPDVCPEDAGVAGEAVPRDVGTLGGLAKGGEPRVVVFSWNVQPEVVARAVTQGAAGFLAKRAPAEAIVAGIESVHAGELVLPTGQTGSIAEPDSPVAVTWPGGEAGLTARESEVVALITQGFSNREIAQRTYLSINSVKTYIRTAYRKMGVRRRAQAVAWGIGHGFLPDRARFAAGGPGVEGAGGGAGT